MDYLVRLRNSTPIRLGVEAVSRLYRELDLAIAGEYVHIAGTNGKGSVSHKLAQALHRRFGFKVGLYTSPHISTVRERIQVNGELLSVHQLESLGRALEPHCGTSVTYFELLTLMALLHFKQEGVDYAVIEAGLGGRTDATNVIPSPAVGVITNVALDHVDFLGGTLEQIAEHKAGIIKKGSHVVLGPNAEPFSVFQRQADLVGAASLVQVGRYPSVNQENSAIASEALYKLIGEKVQIASLEEIRPPCRFQCIQKQGVSIVLDAAHNADAFRRLNVDLYNTFKPPFLFVVAMSTRKSGLNALLDFRSDDDLSAVYITRGSNDSRACSPRELLERELSSQHHSKAIIVDNADEAIESAIRHAISTSSTLVICGTFFIMDRARAALGLEQRLGESDPINMNEK